MISRKLKMTIQKNLGGWLIMLPSLALFLFFIWIPLYNNVILSFYETIGFTRISFIGFDNYRTVIQDPLFVTALGNTFKYMIWSIIIGFFIPIILALILSEVIHFRGLFRAGIYFPNIVPGLAVVLLWVFLMDPEAGGVFNAILSNFGIGPKPWLDDAKMVIPLIVLTMTWKGAGATTLIYLASLQSIDDTYYEAARIEGATIYQRIRHITIPHLLPTIRLLFILQVIAVFQVFYEPLVMTGGGPNNASISLLQLIYRYAFRMGEASKAAALGVIVAVMLFLMTAIYLKISKKAENY